MQYFYSRMITRDRCSIDTVEWLHENKHGELAESRLRVSWIALTHKPDLDNANVGMIVTYDRRVR